MTGWNSKILMVTVPTEFFHYVTELQLMYSKHTNCELYGSVFFYSKPNLALNSGFSQLGLFNARSIGIYYHIRLTVSFNESMVPLEQNFYYN